MKLSNLILLSAGTVSAQENTDLSQLQALLKLPGAQELLANLQKQQAPVEAPLEPPAQVAPVETPEEPSDDEPIEPAHEQSPISVEPASVADVDTDEDVHIVPGQVAASTPGETDVIVPTAEPVLEPTALSSMNQTIQVNATVTPDLVMVNVNQGELANVTVTESVVTATTTNAPVVASEVANPLQPVAELDERLEDEDEPDSAPPVVEEAQPVESVTEASEEEPAAAPSTDASAVFNNLSASDQAALLAKLQASSFPDINLKMANTDMITGQVAAAEPALMTTTTTAPVVNATEAPVETQTEAVEAEEDSPIEAFGSRAEEPDMMMTGTNPEVYGGETEDLTPVTDKPLFTDDAVVVNDQASELNEPDMDENVELDVDENALADEEINEDSFDPYDDYDEDDEWEGEYEENYDEGEFEDEDDGWTQWDDDDEDDLYSLDQDDNLDDEPRNHYDAAYREKLEDYENVLEEQEAVFETEQEAEAAQYNFAFFMILFITVFTGGYYAYGKLREKFFPQSSSVSDYISKKWRYWDLEQQYTPLAKEDGDVKQSVSSEAKADEDWDNENW